MSDPQETGKVAPLPRRDMADLLLVHPAMEAESARVHLGSLWPDGDLRQAPEGYVEISSLFFDLRAFCRSEILERLPSPDPALPARVREWVDRWAESWNLGEVLAVKDLDFWAFLRAPSIVWLHRRMAERRIIEGLAGGGELSVLAAGLSAHQRVMLRTLSDAHEGAIRAEIAMLAPPQLPREETIAEMRLRKMFALLQDGWHGVRLLLEDLFVRRPKVLLVGDSHGWQRGRDSGDLRGRSDVHLGGVWREGRQRPLRLYYRTDRYDPDVGAMTTGRLAPTYLRHFLFLLAQTSRGFWEVRRIQREWRTLRENHSFQESFVFEGLSIGEMMLAWMDAAVAGRLPLEARTTRRETHFLRGTRPDVVVLAEDPEESRPLVAAARRLRIPTVRVQLRPLCDWDHAYLLTRRGKPGDGCLADRFCVFSRDTKAFLVEQGSYDPSAVIVTGDPRRDWMEERGMPQPGVLEEIRRRWGVEANQRVVAVACRPSQCPEVLDWVAEALEGRDDAFVLIHPAAEAKGQDGLYERLSGRRGLRWFHFMAGEPYVDWLQAVDLLVATTWPEIADGILAHTPVIAVHCGEQPGFAGPDPGALVLRADSPEELGKAMADVFGSPARRMPADERHREFVEALYGPGDRASTRRIVDLIEGLAGKA